MHLMTSVELLRAACCVAGIDGYTGKAERQILEKLTQQIGISTETLDTLIHRAETDEAFYAMQFRMINADPIATLEFLFAIALADSELTVSELDVLYRLAQRLKVTDEQFDELRTKAIREVSLLKAG